MPIVSDSRRRLCCALPLLLCLAPSLQAADLAADKAKAKMCAACHGIDGLAKVADAPNLAGNGELYLAPPAAGVPLRRAQASANERDRCGAGR